MAEYEKRYEVKEEIDYDIASKSLLKAYERYRKETEKEEKSYDNSIKKAIRSVAETSFCEGEDGNKITVAEKAAIACWFKTIKEGNTASLEKLAKISGDLVDKQEIKVEGIEDFLQSLKGDKF